MNGIVLQWSRSSGWLGSQRFTRLKVDVVPRLAKQKNSQNDSCRFLKSAICAYKSDSPSFPLTVFPSYSPTRQNILPISPRQDREE